MKYILILFFILSSSVASGQVIDTQYLENAYVTSKIGKLKKFTLDKDKKIFTAGGFFYNIFNIKNLTNNLPLLITTFEKESVSSYYIDHIFFRLDNPNIIAFQKDLKISLVGCTNDSIIEHQALDLDNIVAVKNGLKIILEKSYYFDKSCNKFFIELASHRDGVFMDTTSCNRFYFGGYYANCFSYVRDGNKIISQNIKNPFMNDIELSGVGNDRFRAKAYNLRYYIAYRPY